MSKQTKGTKLSANSVYGNFSSRFVNHLACVNSQVADKTVIGHYKNGNAEIDIYSDGTKVRKVYGDVFIPEFAENIDIKLTNKCSAGCPFCHEGSTPSGKGFSLFDAKTGKEEEDVRELLPADDLIPSFFNTLKPFQEVALGGGNVMEIEAPVFNGLLLQIAASGAIANVTVNQLHFEDQANYERLKTYQAVKLVHGIGVSLLYPTPAFIMKLSRMPNAVIHVIAGIVDKDELDKLAYHGFKLLILGYKKLRRGDDYYNKNKDIIEKRIAWLKDNITDITKKFDVVSFDNLALEQLDIKSQFPNDWNSHYMGDEGSSTFYIDCVNYTFSESSTTPIDLRIPFDPTDEKLTVKKMFEVERKTFNKEVKYLDERKYRYRKVS